VSYRWDLLTSATTLPEQARQIDYLSNAASDLKTWLPGWDGHTGTMPWDRDDDP
jgi:hypothetical protein